MRRRVVLLAGSVMVGVAVAGAVALLSGEKETAPAPGAAPPSPQEEIGTRWLRAPGTESEFAGNAACQTCHPKEFRWHAGTPHARTLHPLAPGTARPEFADPNGVADPTHKLAYTTLAEDGKSWVVVSDGDKAQRGRPDWVFGSGTHAWTYVSRGGNGFVEYRISYYPETKEWNFTPGQGPDDPLAFSLGQVSSDLGAAACFGCHSTVLVGTKERLDLDRSVLNVGCESCHGAAKAHVESAKEYAEARKAHPEAPPSPASLVRPPKPRGEEQVRMCSRCHRQPIDAPEGHPDVEKDLPRFAGAALVRSACFKQSGGKLACTNCHNPHQPASKDASHYDRACLSCHTKPHGNPCLVGETARCASCHMPEVKIARKLPLRFHNHWIRRTAAAAENN